VRMSSVTLMLLIAGASGLKLKICIRLELNIS
jgi:hypothetical protein